MKSSGPSMMMMMIIIIIILIIIIIIIIIMIIIKNQLNLKAVMSNNNKNLRLLSVYGDEG